MAGGPTPHVSGLEAAIVLKIQAIARAALILSSQTTLRRITMTMIMMMMIIHGQGVGLLKDDGDEEGDDDEVSEA